MVQDTILLVGTRKGVFIAASDAARQHWSLRGPFCETWPINHVIADATGTIYAGGGNAWFGPAVWKSTDLGKTWSHSSAGLAYAEGETPISAVWSLAAAHGVLYAGVEPAGLFRSDDAGATWTEVAGLRNHPTRPDWQPGGAGLMLHGILVHPQDPKQLWVMISAVGVLYTADGGASWEHRNLGVKADFLPEPTPEFGQCVHCVAMAPGQPERLYQQSHAGMYRSDTGGRQWVSIQAGLPSGFGFPAAAHPRDPDTVFLLPLNGDTAGRFMPDAQAAVWRSRDAGATWTALRHGLPQLNAYFGVLRQALATDGQTPAGVYFGTTGGGLYTSANEGGSWSCIAPHLPAITSVETLLAG